MDKLLPICSWLLVSFVLNSKHLVTLYTIPQQFDSNIHIKLFNLFISFHKILIAASQTIPDYTHTLFLLACTYTLLTLLERKYISYEIYNCIDLRLLICDYFYVILFEMLFVFLVEELVVVVEEPIELLEVFVGLLWGWGVAVGGLGHTTGYLLLFLFIAGVIIILGSSIYVLESFILCFILFC